MTGVAQKTRYPRDAALEVAQRLVGLLAPACERIEITGSLRRGNPDVGDVELLCIPRYRIAPPQFGDKPTADLLTEYILRLVAEDVLAYRLNTGSHRLFGAKNKLLVDTASGIPVDVFSTDTRNFGMAFVVRTGPKKFNIRMMARFRQLGMRGHAYGGITGRDGKEIDCPDQETVFRLLGWPYLPPHERG